MQKIMRVIILGAGKTGAHVARVVSQEGHDVILIDQDLKTLEQAGRESDVATQHASSPHYALFDELMEYNPDLFFAATGRDETNLVACSIAKNLGIPKTIARIKERDFFNQARLDFGRLFFVDHFIGAEMLAAQDLFNSIVHAGDIAVEHFAHGAIQMRTFIVPQTWNKSHVPIRELTFPADLIIGLIRRNKGPGEEILFPRGEDLILAGDEITVIGEAKIMHSVHAFFRAAEHPVRSVIIAGGTVVASHLAHLLLQQKIAVRIIETDPQRCEELADLHEEATLINRDARDLQFLKSERIEDVDALISCTHDDGKNLLIGAIGKQLGCKKAIALTSDSLNSPIFEKAGVIPALSAYVNVANQILAILHEETLLSVASLNCDVAKIVELKVDPSSSLVGIPLAELQGRLPKDFLIAVIQSRGRVMVGKGNRILSPDDTVIAICHPHQIPKLPELFH